VVWLNEAQFYLDTPLGEQVAAGLRELLRNPARGPVLILATLWPEHWNTLISRPAGPDSHTQARELLTGHKIQLPDAFTDHDIRQLDDPRLAEAATGYLGDDEWDALDDDWLEAALAYTTKRGNGIPGPLTRVRPRAVVDPGASLYRLADSLEQTGSRDRAGTYPPTSLWIAISRLTDPHTLYTLGRAAHDRGFHVAILPGLLPDMSRQNTHARTAEQAVGSVGHVDEAMATGVSRIRNVRVLPSGILCRPTHLVNRASLLGCRSGGENSAE
jgi:hypothetical protein